MLFPAAKLFDTVIGVDLHTVIIPPAPAPIPLTPHAYMGALMLWITPAFPAFSSGIVLINSIPACTVGAMGYGAHVPIFVPAPPTFTNFMSYWRHHLTMVPKLLCLMAATTVASMAIGALAAALPASSAGNATADFMKDVTGVDTRASGWASIKGSFASYCNWFTWAHLLIPPAPYPVGQGSTAVGSPNVFVNGGPLAFVCPLVGASCSDIPFIPNAVILGFTNVFVGVSPGAVIRGMAVHSAQQGIAFGVNKAVEMGTRRPGQTPCS